MMRRSISEGARVYGAEVDEFGRQWVKPMEFINPWSGKRWNIDGPIPETAGRVNGCSPMPGQPSLRLTLPPATPDPACEEWWRQRNAPIVFPGTWHMKMGTHYRRSDTFTLPNGMVVQGHLAAWFKNQERRNGPMKW